MKESNLRRATTAAASALRRLVAAVLGVLGLGLQFAGATAPTPTAAVLAPAQGETPKGEAAFGIQVEGLRLTAGGSMLDLRYRVLDAEKAAPLLNGKIQPYLLDEARSARLGVPDTPTLGRIRQTSRNNVIRTDRIYFVMFGNPGKALRSGDKVALLLGPVKIADLTVR